MSNGIRVIEPPAGTLPYQEGFGTTLQAAGQGLQTYQQTRRKRLMDALTKLYLRSQLSGGELGNLSKTEALSLRELGGIENVSGLSPFALKRGLNVLSQQYLGVKGIDPVDQAFEIERKRQDASRKAGLPGLPPTAAYREAYKSMTGLDWPTDPATGEPLPYQFKTSTATQPGRQEEKLRKALGVASVTANEASQKDLKRRRAAAQDAMTKSLGLGWEQIHPDAKGQFDNLFPDPADPKHRAQEEEDLKRRAFSGDKKAYQELERRYPELFAR